MQHVLLLSLSQLRILARRYSRIWVNCHKVRHSLLLIFDPPSFSPNPRLRMLEFVGFYCLEVSV